MDDSYLTILKPVLLEIKVKGSRFIGEAIPVVTVESAMSAIDEIRKREHLATHHCYAYMIGPEPDVQFKYSDDGEPNGTAGKPIFDCITGRNLTNTLVVVTRYFGGTKLGTGGLARAYSNSAKQTIESAKIKTVYLTELLNLKFDFKFYDSIQRLLNNFGAGQQASEFTENVMLKISIRRSKTEILIEEMTELTSGQIEIEKD